MSQNLFTLLRNRTSDNPDAPFLLRPNRDSISYAELISFTGRLANLFATLGVGPGDRIAAQAEKSVELLFVYLATLRAGAVFLPLNPAYTRSEIRYFLGDAEPALFVCSPTNEDEMADLCTELGVPHLFGLGADGQGSLIDAAAGHGSAHEDIVRSGDDLAAILYTSGTTGRSKGAMLSHENLWSNAETLRDYWRFCPADRLLHALPIYHTHGLFVATNTIMASGAAMIFLERFSAAELVRSMPEANVLMGVPTFYSRLLAEPSFNRDAAASMRLFISGSAPLSAEVHRQFEERTGHAILERYGMTETSMITSNPYDGDRVPGSVGFPLPGVDVRIADSGTGEVIADGIGVIEVRGPNVFSGYWRMPEQTAESFRADGFFITGDMGMIDERGYVHIVGRAKDLIISGGLNVYPAEVEAVLDAVPGIAESAVIGIAHPDLGEAVVAVVQASEPGLDEAVVIEAMDGELARFKQPKRVIFVPELPRNAMGKVQKKLLREEHARLFGSAMSA